jgi:hypothetical protein
MHSVGVLLIFAVLGAAICAKARFAGGAVLFALVALVLFVATPAGQDLPGAIARFFSSVDKAVTPVLTDGGSP